MMDWFKAFQDGILRGSLATTTDTTQLIWLKLLAIENETRLRDGWLHYKVGNPMPRDYLATICNVSLKEFNIAIEEFLGDLDPDGNARIEIAPDGDIFIKNWDKFQAKPEKVLEKEAGIEKRKRDSQSLKNITIGLTRAVNETNRALLRLEKKVGKDESEKLLQELLASEDSAVLELAMKLIDAQVKAEMGGK